MVENGCFLATSKYVIMRQLQLASFLYALMTLEKLFWGTFQSTLNYFCIYHSVTKAFPQWNFWRRKWKMSLLSMVREVIIIGKLWTRSPDQRTRFFFFDLVHVAEFSEYWFPKWLYKEYNSLITF